MRYTWRFPVRANGPLHELSRRTMELALQNRIRERLRETYDVSICEDTSLDLNALELTAIVPKPSVHYVLAAINSSLRSKRYLAPYVEFVRLDYLHDETTLDLDAWQSAKDFSEYAGLRQKVPGLSATVRHIMALTSDEVLDYIRNHCSPEMAVVDIYETDK